MLALDDLWTFADPEGGSQVSLLDTIQDPSAVDPEAEAQASRGQGPPRRRDRVAARARAARRRPLLLREPDPARDRRGARRDRVARLPAAHQGRARPALAGSRLQGLLPPTSAAERYVSADGPQGRRPDSQRRPDRPSRQRQDRASPRRCCSRPGSSTGSARSTDGSTVSDFEPDEQERGMSIGAAVASFEHDGRKINLIDTPGEPSFIADTLAALRVVDAAVVVVNAVMGVEVHTDRLWQRADEEGLARLVFVNMLDRERADFFRCARLAEGGLRPRTWSRPRSRSAPSTRCAGSIDLIDMKAFEYARATGGAAPKQIEIPEELAGAGRGVPREADGRGRGELRRADGALPRGRGDRPRRDRHGAQAGGHRGPALPGHLRGRDQEPRHQPAARGAGRGPALAGDARRGRRRSAPTARRSRSSPTRTASWSPTSSRRPPIPTPGGSTSSASTRGVLALRLAGRST